MRYPSYVYSPREDVTRNAMREFDIKKKKFYEKCLEINPNYYKLGIRERLDVRGKAETELGFTV